MVVLWLCRKKSSLFNPQGTFSDEGHQVGNLLLHSSEEMFLQHSGHLSDCIRKTSSIFLNARTNTSSGDNKIPDKKAVLEMLGCLLFYQLGQERIPGVGEFFCFFQGQLDFYTCLIFSLPWSFCPR